MTQATHITEREQYLEDCRETDKPWERWEFCDLDGQWYSCITEPGWDAARQYRRKPLKYIRIGDAIVPAPIRGTKEVIGEAYWIVSGTLSTRVVYVEGWISAETQQSFFDSGMAYATEADAQRAADALRKLLTQTPFPLDAAPKSAAIPVAFQQHPEYGVRYFSPCFTKSKTVLDLVWDGGSFDRALFDFGLAFDTREKAEQAVAIIRNLFRPQAA